MKVYVINLPEAEERRNSIIKEMKKTNLSYEFIIPEPSENIESDNPGWTKGANSLRLTTIKLIEQAIKNNEDSIWIWEDDSIINKDHFYTFVEDLSLIDDFDFIHLNWKIGGVSSIRSIGCMRKTLSGTFCCQSYIINKNIFEEYLKELKVERPIDATTKLLHKKNKNSYLVEPPVVSHIPGNYSYIRKEKVTY